MCEEWSLYVRLLGKAQTKLSLAVPNGGKGNMWGRQGEPGLLLLLLSGDREEGGSLRGDAAGRGCLLFPQRWLLLPVESRPFLLGPPWYFSHWQEDRSFTRLGVLFLISKDHLIYFKQIDRAWRRSQEALVIYFSTDFQLWWNARIKCKNIPA